MSTQHIKGLRRHPADSAYAWEDEPLERPTGFEESSYLSSHSGYFHSTGESSLERHRRRVRHHRRRGSGGLMVGLVLVMGLTTGLLWMASRVLAAFR